MKVVFAVLSILELKKYAVWEGSKTLSTDKTLLMPNFATRIDNLFVNFETFATPKTNNVT